MIKPYNVYNSVDTDVGIGRVTLTGLYVWSPEGRSHLYKIGFDEPMNQILRRSAEVILLSSHTTPFF